MKLKIHNLHTIVRDASDEEHAWLKNYLSFEDATARYRYNKDAKIILYNRLQRTFPSGVLSLVSAAARKKGFNVQIADERKALPANIGADLSWLRLYQKESVMAAQQHTRGIIWAPTGAGKTEIAIGIVRSMPCRWVFLVHRKSLVTQAAERYELRTGDQAITLTSTTSNEELEDAEFLRTLRDLAGQQKPQFIVATFQTMVAALKRDRSLAEKVLASAGGLMVDESHTLPADTFYNVAMSTPHAYWRFGLSGTPLARGDKRSVKAVAALGSVIYRIRSETLIQAGVLAKPKIKMTKCHQTSTKPTYQGIYGDIVVRSPKRNSTVVDCAVKAAKPCMVFVKQINHGNALKKKLAKAGIAADFVSGKEPEHKRQRMKQALERGDRDVLIASVVFQEGIDIPNLESVVMAHGGKSVIATLQRIGRGMRTDGGRKKEFEVWDIFDTGCAMLERHSKIRKRAYERESFSVKVVG